MEKILIISGHPNIDESVANKKILYEIKKKISDVKITYLDKLYSDYKIDVKFEQQKLIDSDIIIFQYPIFWYDMPSLLKNGWRIHSNMDFHME